MSWRRPLFFNTPRIGRRYPDSAETWKVLTDGPMIEEGPASGFVLYEGPEFHTGH
ncbi:MAG TPA: hypothetical protein VFU49_17450 [Ktedonobacteraceae bacterium]|nr:hypothetical protein [Ktedonobacteraceae bacterium]